uniref:HD domain-containing protein n=1 Tax=Bionectria ochroleuca TaxID=29856 RepID=A0A8H7N0P2_BIOOC
MALPSVEEHTRATIRELFSFILAQGHTEYLGESVSQLQHSLQSALQAQQDNCDDETVLAALMHDVGRFIPAADKMPKLIAPDGSYIGRASHDILGERYLRQLGFSEKVCQLVGSHVTAKRYLCAAENGYWESLSLSSKRTLEYQGGRFTPEQVKEAENNPWLQEKLAVRRYDDLAKNPDAVTPPLEAYQEMAYKCLLESRSSINLNSRTYALPTKPTVVVCIDGFDPSYLRHGISTGTLPHLASLMEKGFSTTAKSAMPSITNPNNVSIVTGVPPSVHGIAGNTVLDRATGEEVSISDATHLRTETILSLLSRHGVRVAAVTAKEKLRQILGHQLHGAICFSAQKAKSCKLSQETDLDIETWMGRATPDQYSPDLSLFVMDAGVKLLGENRADFLYLTLSDWVQHKYAPGEKEADTFMTQLDASIGRLLELGARVAITGDHGMASKTKPDGTPNVVYLQDELEARFGKGSARVICPIADPLVKHHGSFGAFVRVYVSSEYKESISEMIKYCATLEHVDVSLSATDAAERFELPLDLEGDFVVTSGRDSVIGSCRKDHDIGSLGGLRLRSHGGIAEQDVPLILSCPVQDGAAAAERKWRNFDVFDLVLNW